MLFFLTARDAASGTCRLDDHTRFISAPPARCRSAVRERPLPFAPSIRVMAGAAVELDVRGLSAGTYQVVLHTARGTASGRLNVVR